MHIRTRSAVVGLSLVALLVAACGGGATPSPSPSSAAPSVAPSDAPSVAPSASASASALADDDATVELADNALGSILVDAEGRTLYAFTNDTAGESTCYDVCEDNWPPLVVTGQPVAGDGVGALSTVERTDGTLQVKIGDWPLYYFAGDAAAGDTKGQGLQEKWYVVDADGELIGA